MTPFYSFRLFDLKDSTRENSHNTMVHVCTPLGLKPMGVYLPIKDNLKTLIVPHKMILKNHRRAFFVSPVGIDEKARRKDDVTWKQVRC